MTRLGRAPSRAFTLTEVIVVLGVIGVLTAILMPTLKSIRDESRSAVCLSNLKQIHAALETYRQNNNTLLPYAEPLPAPGPEAAPGDDPQPIGGLNNALRLILPKLGDHWICPADYNPASQSIGTSYFYLAGAGMLAVPFNPQASIADNKLAAARAITAEYDAGFLKDVPLVFDSEDRHVIGTRQPRNGVFIDGRTAAWAPNDPGTGASDTP